MTKKLTVKIYVQQSSIDDLDESQLIAKLFPSSYDSELFIMKLIDPQLVQLLLLRYIGYDYQEITKILQLRNIGQFYFLWNKLQKEFEKYQQKKG
jgi:hypothetical protein